DAWLRPACQLGGTKPEKALGSGRPARYPLRSDAARDEPSEADFVRLWRAHPNALVGLPSRRRRLATHKAEPPLSGDALAAPSTNRPLRPLVRARCLRRGLRRAAGRAAEPR